MTSAAPPPVLLSTPSEGVRLLTLNQPQIRNAMTEDLTAGWNTTLDALAEDDSVRALVVTGAGPSFCSGADLSWLDSSDAGDVTVDKISKRMVPFYRSWLRPRFLPFPVIAAVNGAAIGAGLAVALACDLRYGSENSVFSAPFIHLGTHPGIAITALLPEAIGVPRAREMLYTGRDVTAGEALDWGLVNGIAADVVEHSLAVAGTLAAAAPIAARLAKTGLRHAALGVDSALEWESLAQPVTLNTKDLHEGIRARRARRDPSFTGE